MKKLIVAFCAVSMAAAAARAEFIWNWWTTSNEGKPAKTELSGCSLGIASALGTCRGAQIDLLFNTADAIKSGVQGSIGYSRTGTLRNGVQTAFVCSAERAALQLGLICFNGSGFLPVFPFFNLDTKQFGSGK